MSRADYSSVKPADPEDPALPVPLKTRGRACWTAIGVAAALGACGGLFVARGYAFPWRGGRVFFDDFSTIDHSKWTVERSLDDGGNGEFQAYTDDPAVVYTEDGRLVIQPRPMTSDRWSWLSHTEVGNFSLKKGDFVVDECTGTDNQCAHAGKWDEPHAPVVSAKLTSKGKFQFRYGSVEARLKLPKGDWIWPAVWLLPADEHYGPWPFSGEIDLLEARGNDPSFEVVGSAQSGPAGNDKLAATVHCADRGGGDAFAIGNTTLDGLEDAEGFVVIGLDWTADAVVTYARQGAGKRVLAAYSTTQGPVCGNKAYKGRTDIAPFDREFYFVINVAVGGSAGGGIAYWGDAVPWKTCDHPHFCDPRTDFQQREAEWLPTWTQPLEIDWISVRRD